MPRDDRRGGPGAATRSTRAPALDPADAELFAAARLRAARQQPYLASALFALVPVPAPGFGTFGVDRWWRVYVDMEVARGWGVAATAAVLVHEAHHVVRDHHGRADAARVPARLARTWNLATDAAINDDLVADGLPLPSPVLPRHLELDDHGIEEQYFRQLVEAERAGSHPSCGSGAGGEPLSIETDQAPDRSGVDGVDQLDGDAIRRAVAHDVVDTDSRGGSVSPGLTLWARDLLAPQVPWRRVLRSVLGRPVREVTSRPHPDWCRPDRRGDAHPDVLRPGHRHHRPDVAVVVDTSASMSQHLLDAATTEVDGLLRRTGIREVTVVVCDTTAVRPQRVRRVGDLRLSGGGGTDLRVGIDAAARLRPRPALIVVLTDGWTPWPDVAPPRTRIVAVVIGPDAPLPTGDRITALRVDEGHPARVG